ncbi:hypothetical protein P3J6_110295 [Pseudoalteromonas sp. 3J6]|nr:hypothetical protein P3J6_110295 [Pseudoalteromonas sp. 3J6]
MICLQPIFVLIFQINNFKQMGITSVPTFIINDKYAPTGGQPSESFIQALKQINEEEAKQD